MGTMYMPLHLSTCGPHSQYLPACLSKLILVSVFVNVTPKYIFLWVCGSLQYIPQCLYIICAIALNIWQSYAAVLLKYLQNKNIYKKKRLTWGVCWTWQAGTHQQAASSGRDQQPPTFWLLAVTERSRVSSRSSQPPPGCLRRPRTAPAAAPACAYAPRSCRGKAECVLARPTTSGCKPFHSHIHLGKLNDWFPYMRSQSSWVLFMSSIIACSRRLNLGSNLTSSSKTRTLSRPFSNTWQSAPTQFI